MINLRTQLRILAWILGTYFVLFPTAITYVDFRSISVPLKISVNRLSPSFAAIEDSQFQMPSKEIPQEQATAVLGERIISVAAVEQPPRVVNLKPMRIARADFEAPVVAKQIAKTPVAFEDELIEGARPLRSEALVQQAVEEQGYATPSVVEPLVHELAQMDWSQPSVSGAAATLVTQNSIEQNQKKDPEDHRLPNDTDEVYHAASGEMAGNIEMAGGLPYSRKNNRITISRKESDEVRDIGRVSSETGTYKIAMTEPKGKVVAELWDGAGEVIGRGEVTVAKLTAADLEKDVPIKIEPVKMGALGRVISANSFQNYIIAESGSRVDVDNISSSINVDKDGRFQEPAVLSGSSFLLRADKRNNVGALALASSGNEENLVLFPISMMSGILDLAGYATIPRGGAIWGQVLDENGQPVEGATVEVASEKTIRPIYFSTFGGGMLPNTQLIKTSANGLFAFVELNQDAYLVRASRGQKLYTSEIVPIEAQRVTQVQLAPQISHKVEARVFNALYDQPLVSRTLLLDTGVEYQTGTTGSVKLDLPSAQKFSAVEVDAGEGYELTRQIFSRGQDIIYLPQIQMNWLATLFHDSGFVRKPDMGVVVGFVEGNDFKVELSQEETDAEIFYFNAQSRLSGNQEGYRGGGFVIANLDNGIHTIQIMPKDSSRTFSQVVWVDSQAVSTMAIQLKQ